VRDVHRAGEEAPQGCHDFYERLEIVCLEHGLQDAMHLYLLAVPFGRLCSRHDDDENGSLSAEAPYPGNHLHASLSHQHILGDDQFRRLFLIGLVAERVERFIAASSFTDLGIPNGFGKGAF
jgi:hypothetical protein